MSGPVSSSAWEDQMPVSLRCVRPPTATVDFTDRRDYAVHVNSTINGEDDNCSFVGRGGCCLHERSDVAIGCRPATVSALTNEDIVRFVSMRIPDDAVITLSARPASPISI